MRFPHQIELAKPHVRHVAQNIPKDVRELLTENYGKLFLAGGFVREIVAGNKPCDIDLFADSYERAKQAADSLVKRRGGEPHGTRMHVSGNAITVLTPGRLPVQFITRWTFEKPCECADSFDFTVCQAVIWRAGNQSNSKWETLAHREFYRDLAGRTLVYTNPKREEEAGGSLMRVLKFLKRGYSIQVGSLGDVLCRVIDKIDFKKRENSSVPTAAILDGILREVDPLMVIDGFDLEDDHAEVPGAEADEDSL